MDRERYPPSDLVKQYPDLEPVPVDSLLDIIISYIDLTSRYYTVVDNNNGLVQWIEQRLLQGDK